MRRLGLTAVVIAVLMAWFSATAEPEPEPLPPGCEQVVDLVGNGYTLDIPRGAADVYQWIERDVKRCGLRRTPWGAGPMTHAPWSG